MPTAGAFDTVLNDVGLDDAGANSELEIVRSEE